MKYYYLKIILCTFFLLGCATANRSILMGTAAGAAAGAFIGPGFSPKNKKNNAAAGTLVGALLGMAVGGYVHDKLEKRDDRTRRQLILNLEKHGIGDARREPPRGETPLLAKPSVNSQWVGTRIEGDRLIEGHRVWIIEENAKWVGEGGSGGEADR